VPTVEIIVGFAHFAKYEFFLYDPSGQNPQKFAEGVNSDAVPDIFPINDPAGVQGLDKRTLFWQAAIASPTGAPNEQYSVLIRVVQDGTIVGTDTKTGPLTDPLPFGFIRFNVV
jgi:hypothetical protein